METGETDVTDQRTDSRIDVAEVTLLEDRALVRRRGVVSLVQGRNRLVVEGVSPLVIDKSLLGEARASAAKVVDARIVRQRVFVDASKPEDIRQLDEEILLAERALRTAEERRRALVSERDGVGQITASFVNDLAVDASWGRSVVEKHRTSLGELTALQRSAHETVASLDIEIDRMRKDLDRKRTRRSALERPTARVAARLELDVEADAPTEAELAVSYVVPNACWRPRHRAVLSMDPASVTFSTEGVVWQNTGERWSGVLVSFSTERPSLGTEPPKLEADILSAVRKGALVVETREQRIEDTGLGAAKKKVAEVPGIDDGGEALSLRAEHPVDIESDGRPTAVPISTFSAEADLELVAMPELVRAALLKTTFDNAGTGALLAGPVELVRDGGHVGKTSIGFIARGERLELGWGPDANVRIHREIDHKKDETSVLSAWTTKTHDVKLRLSNLGPYAKSILVKERVTVSEIDKVEVKTVPRDTTGEQVPDENGVVTWRVELPPLGRSTVRLRVVTRVHSDAG